MQFEQELQVIANCDDLRYLEELLSNESVHSRLKVVAFQKLMRIAAVSEEDAAAIAEQIAWQQNEETALEAIEAERELEDSDFNLEETLDYSRIEVMNWLNICDSEDLEFADDNDPFGCGYCDYNELPF